MNIVVLNGSPRPRGNTAAMVQAFTEGATESGHQVTVVNIGNKRISGCKHCDYCHTKERGRCAQKDDMQEIYPVLAEAEMLVIASPIYYFSMTGQTHCAIERMYIWEVLPKIKKTALFLSALESGFEAAIQTYRDVFIGYMGAEDRGLLRPPEVKINRNKSWKQPDNWAGCYEWEENKRAGAGGDFAAVCGMSGKDRRGIIK